MTTASSRRRLHGLYAITDENLIPEADFSQCITAALEGGASIIQYRDKSDNTRKRLRQAEQLRKLCSAYNALCIINDDISLAKTVSADGVHLGEHDADPEQARAELGESAIIGVSCYNQLALAEEAEKKGADYVAFGAMFASTTKPQARLAGVEIIGQAKAQSNIPVCAIGGITPQNMPALIEQGADMTAVIGGLFFSADIENTARAFSRFFSQGSP